MARYVEAVQLYVHDDGEALSDHIVREQDYFERDILDYLATNYPIHTTILDVGANIGNHTVFFANRFIYNTIYAFEPVSQNYDLLRQNTSDLEGVRIRHVAVGADDRTVHVYISPSNMGACEIKSGYIAGSDYQTVQQIKLDDLFIPKVTLIKIDVEWYEPQVLLGAKSLIKEDKPLILIEDANEEYGALLPDYYNLLKAWPEHKTYLYGAPHQHGT